MKVRPIVIGKDNPILRTVSKEASKVDNSIKKLSKELKEGLKKHKGLGLAAPQIGENLRVIAVILNNGTDSELTLILINPIIKWRSEETLVAEEGCLSLPEIFLNIERHKAIEVEFLNLKNQKQRLKLTDLNARVVQHEIDHLNAVLIVDKAVQVQEG